MTDPDLEIRGGGGSGHPDPEIRGGTVPPKIFSAPWAPFWSKNKGEGGTPGPSPRSPPLKCGREEKPDAKAVFCPFTVFKKTMPFASINCVDYFTF